MRTTVTENNLDLSELDEKEREASNKIALLEAQISQLETLLKYLVQLNTQSQTTALLAATNDRVVHKGSIISDAKSRWQENMKGVRSSTGTDGDDANSGEGEESVNR